MELTRKLEESKLKEKVSHRTTEMLSKGLEFGADVYVKTSDKIDQINVSNYPNKIGHPR